MFVILIFSFFFKQKPAYDVRISDWSSDVCSSDLNKVSDGRDKDRHLPGPLFGGPAVLRHRVHGPLALREHGNLSRRGIETDRDDADPGRFRGLDGEVPVSRSEEHTSELQSLMRISYAVFCLKKKNINKSISNKDIPQHVSYIKQK